jgi:release factor glutamine methyltransferase
VNEQIIFLQMDLFGDYTRYHVKKPIIIANLPYLPQKTYQEADQSVRLEPKQAHLGGKKGYEIIEKFLKQAQKIKPQAIFLEFHYEYKNELKKIIKRYLPNYNVGFKKDLAERERVAIILPIIK